MSGARRRENRPSEYHDDIFNLYHGRTVIASRLYVLNIFIQRLENNSNVVDLYLNGGHGGRCSPNMCEKAGDLGGSGEDCSDRGCSTQWIHSVLEVA